jgi:hypothetical protein
MTGAAPTLTQLKTARAKPLDGPACGGSDWPVLRSNRSPNGLVNPRVADGSHLVDRAARFLESTLGASGDHLEIGAADLGPAIAAVVETLD